MAITAYTMTRFGTTTTVEVTSDLSGTIFYHWYADGAYLGMTTTPARTFALEYDEMIRVECQDTTDADYDPIANAPDGWPARRSIFWTRSTDTDAAGYRVEQKAGAGDWTEIGRIHQNATAWSFAVLSPRLTDLTVYQWRVVPMDAAGNDGTPITLDAETVVRTPDAPDFEFTYDEDTDQITFAAA